MPAIRTQPDAAKAAPLKTERTHEENQERAYIAASRRSDRSLEARVESARRASEIHKKRTGRALRVTEQDVLDEEMYEEEDDLPTSCRRLTAHLQTGSTDFNRRLCAYLANHVAMRTRMDPTAQQVGSLGDQGQSAAVYAGVFANSMMQQPQRQQQEQHAGQSPSAPMQTSAQRSLSISVPQEFKQEDPKHIRRCSEMADVTITKGASMRRNGPSFPHGAFATANANFMNSPTTHDGMPFGSTGSATPDTTSNVIATALPPESQQFLAGHLDNSDPQTAMLMAGASSLPQYWPTQTSTGTSMSELNKLGGDRGQLYPTFDGLNSTLGGAYLMAASPPGEQSQEYSTMGAFDEAMVAGPSTTSTPGIEAWDMFVNNDRWETPQSSQ